MKAFYNGVEITHLQQPKSPDLPAYKRFSRAFNRWRQHGYPKRSKEEYKAIKAMCLACPYWDPKANFGFGKCSKCGCSKFKGQWATEMCPLGLWLKIAGLTWIR